MNKKLTAIIVGAVAVVAIVLISIFGTMAENTDNEINVLGIVVTLENQNPTTYTDEDGSTIVKMVTITDETEYSIVYTVLPENATNKAVSFSADSTSATVNEIGLVTFLERTDVVVTLTAQDGTHKKAAIHFTFPGIHESTMSVTMEQEAMDFVPTPDEPVLHQIENNTLVLLETTKYQMDIEEDTSIEIVDEQTTTVLTGIVLETMGTEEFVLRFTKTVEGGEPLVQNVSVKVIPYLQTFNMGSHYQSYLSTMADFEKPEEEQVTDFLNKTASPYLVGTGNEYYFNLKMMREIPEGTAEEDFDNYLITQSELELSYTVKDGANQTVELSTIASLSGNNLTFLPAAVGNTYTFTVAPKNNILARNAVSFTVKVNEGMNVWTSDQLFNTFKDLTTEEINIHTNLIVTPRENQLTTNMFNDVEETRLKNFGGLNNGSDALREDSGTLFPRYIPSTYTENNNLVVNGNFFLIDAEDVPLYSYEKTGGQFGYLPWANNISSVQEALFAVQDARTVENKVANGYTASVTFNNMNIKANSAKGPIYTLDDEGDLTSEEENNRLVKQGSGLPAIMTRGSVVNVNNTSVRNSLYSFWSAYQMAELNLENTKTYDVWGGAVYGWGSSEINLTNTHFTRMGGAAISYQDPYYTDENAPAYADLILTFNENAIIDNYISGTEGWFVANGFTAAVPTLKTMVEGTLNSVGKSMIKFDTELQAETFNYILQIQKDFDKPEPTTENPVWPELDFQYTINQIIGTDEVSGDRIYRTTQRKNGFLSSHPFTTLAASGGTYLGSLGSYSSTEEYKALQHTIALVNGYLTDDVNLKPIVANFGGLMGSTIETIYSSLTGGAPLAAFATMPAETQQQILLAISGYQDGVSVDMKELGKATLQAYSAFDATTAAYIISLMEADDSTKMGAFAIGLVFDEYKQTEDILEIMTKLVVSESMGEQQLALYVGYTNQQA